MWITGVGKWLQSGKWWDRMVHMWEKVGNRESDPDLQHGMVKVEKLTPVLSACGSETVRGFYLKNGRMCVYWKETLSLAQSSR